MTNLRAFYYILFSLYIIIQANGKRTKDKMYEKIEGTSACFRRLNSTHQIGCTSARSGSIGVIHVAANETELDKALNELPAGPYMLVMPVAMLTPDSLKKILDRPDQVSGLVVHQNVSKPLQYSNEARCPNQDYGLKDQCIDNGWNPWGTGILQGDYPFPIFLVTDDENLHKIEDCFHKFNNYDLENQHLRSLCALELNSFMFAAVNSQTCIRRGNSWTTFTSLHFCDPLGDRNIWTSLFPWENNTDTVKDVIAVMARMDATSMFYETTPGAESTVSGMVALLATAELLNRMIAEDGNARKQYDRNVFFLLVNGESYDYLGSQRLVYDILHGKFPLRPDRNYNNSVLTLDMDDIKLVVELGQLAKRDALYVHRLKNDSSDQQINNFTRLLNANSRMPIKLSSQQKLPPASIQSFLQERPGLPAMLLTDHDGQFSNPYYNSLYDNADNLRYEYVNVTLDQVDATTFENTIQEWIADVAHALASSLYEQVTGDKYNGLESKHKTQFYVNELMNCYLDTVSCKIFRAVILKDYLGDKPLGMYVSVVPAQNVRTTLTGYALAWLTGSAVNRTEADCTGSSTDPVFQYLWMSNDLDNLNSTQCFKTTMNFTLAMSPAFDVKDYDWKSGRYSTWTESVWKDFSARMFLKPSFRHEMSTLAAGTVVLLLSLAVVYFVKRRSHLLFPRPDAAAEGPGTSC